MFHPPGGLCPLGPVLVFFSCPIGSPSLLKAGAGFSLRVSRVRCRSENAPGWCPGSWNPVDGSWGPADLYSRAHHVRFMAGIWSVPATRHRRPRSAPS